ncbi:glycosyltransferase family 1 protein [Roseomonas sp. M0104]|uniref:Glycosyltransferase family 1 protein n=1 Tax=Teichococcus coralli TaxID=2545983 RepID=A0A845B2N4_9PROT|nr:glycosyltransferase family 1 protein [Pseudoroseomonas coralli]MXP61923.1 glycosyltransferase family 1 protein [Pseudoroseomonas coralli]
MRLLLATDAWAPQVNGVVRTLTMTTQALRQAGDEVLVLGPDRFPGMPAPGEPALRLAFCPPRRLSAMVAEFAPEAVHIATEGPLGWAMRGLCRRRGWRFTTAFHTRFPEYLRLRFGVPVALSWRALRRFHAPAAGTFVATDALRQELAAQGFGRLRRWSRGVDTALFRPGLPDALPGLPRPIFLQAGRLAAEKGVERFLALDLPGSKVVVGDGPARAALQRRFPQAHFTGFLRGEALAAAYASADVFVFPSRTDTFGLVLLEALACGTPLAAHPQPGPLAVTADAAEPVGALDEDLRAACLRALEISRSACRAQAERFSWATCAAQFRSQLVPLRG